MPTIAHTETLMDTRENTHADDEASAERYAVELGERLRNVRQQQDMSLHDVEDASEGELKASVVGAYERGERAVSVSRLRALADFYRVPVSSLLPSGGAAGSRARRGDGERLVIDLTRLDHGMVEVEEREVIERYVGAIQAQRGDYNGRVLTVRSSDVRALAAVLDRDVPEFRDHLASVGVARTV